jgi:hypothetical protein
LHTIKHSHNQAFTLRRPGRLLGQRRVWAHSLANPPMPVRPRVPSLSRHAPFAPAPSFPRIRSVFTVVAVAAAFPDPSGLRVGRNGRRRTRREFFSLGGNELFRGFDPRERQGSVVWVGSVEWRVPLVRRVEYDVCDHLVGVRNIYTAAFYDIGDAYVASHSYGPVAHAVGLGLRLDLAWLGVVERTTMRFDVAKTVNADTPWQFWFGLHHPF